MRRAGYGAGPAGDIALAEGSRRKMKELPRMAIPLIDHTLDAAILKPKIAEAPPTPVAGR